MSYPEMERKTSVVVTDKAGSIVAANSAAEELLGFTRAEILGRSAHILDDLPVAIRATPVDTPQGTLVVLTSHEDDLILREVHEGVSNHLQIIASLLDAQGDMIGDGRARAVFTAARIRIQSMAVVHEKFGRSSDLARIDLNDYLRTLGERLLHSFAGSRPALHVGGDRVFLRMDQAFSCGLIANELLSNAMKHGFPSGQPGTIEVSVKDAGDFCSFTVRDDGVGLTASSFDRHDSTLGLPLIQKLIPRIDGLLEAHTPAGGGTSVTIRFRKERRRD